MKHWHLFVALICLGSPAMAHPHPEAAAGSLYFVTGVLAGALLGAVTIRSLVKAIESYWR